MKLRVVKKTKNAILDENGNLVALVCNAFKRNKKQSEQLALDLVDAYNKVQMSKNKEYWLNEIYSLKYPPDLVYKMDKMEYPELKSLIESVDVCEVDNGFIMPRFVSHSYIFNLYNRMFTVLYVKLNYDYKTGELRGLRIRICDIDDGDEVYLFKTNDKIEAASEMNFWLNKFKDCEILDTIKVRDYLNERGYERD